MELITRQIIRDFEGEDAKNIDRYATTGTPEYERMVTEIARRLGLSTLKFSTIEALVESIGLPKDQICTHCFDGTGKCPAEAYARDHSEK